MKMVNKLKSSAVLYLIVAFLVSCTEKKKEITIQTPNDSSQKITSTSLYNLDISFLNQRSEKLKWSSLRGNPIILSMIFTNCSSACPLIVENIKSIKCKIHDPKNRMQYILVSFDTERDSPKQLMIFCKERSLGKNWTLLTGDEDDIKMLAMALDIKFEKSGSGDFSHSNTIVLLNPQGDIVSRTDVLDEDNKDMTFIADSILRQP